MDVVAGAEDLLQHLLVGDVGEHPQLDLAVVGGEQAGALLGDEAGADRAADLGADRDVLQVRVGAREAPGRRRRLVEGRVDAAGLGVDQVRQRVEVGVLQLGQLAPGLDLLDDRVLVADLGEDAGVGREAGLAAALAGQAELLEEDRADLLRRADRELLPGQLVDLRLERRRSARRSRRRPRRGARRRASGPRAPSPPARRPAAARPRAAAAPGRAPRCAGAGRRRGPRRGAPPRPGRGRASPSSPSESWPSSLVRRRRRPRRDRSRRRRRARPARRCGAAARAGRRRPSCRGRASSSTPSRGGGGEQAVAAAAERLDVVGDERRARRARPRARRVERRRRRSARRRPPPSVAVERQRDRALGEVGRRCPPRPRPRARSRPLRPGTASPSGSASSSRSITARSSNSRMKSRRAPRSGSAAIASPQVDLGLDVVLHRRQLLRDAGVVGVLDQVLLALGAGDLVDVREHLLERSRTAAAAAAAVFSPIPGTPGMLSEVSPAQAHQVGDQLRRHPVALDHRLAVVDLGLGDRRARCSSPGPRRRPAGRRRGRR